MDFLFVANLLCLDFANTEPVDGGARVELLPDFAALVRWLRQAGVLGDREAVRALERWNGTAESRAAWREAIALRSALQGAAERLAAGRSAGEPLVHVVNRLLKAGPAYRRLVREGGRYVTRLESASGGALQLLTPVAASAAWLLEHGERALVRRCQGSGCVLFFYDTSRNRSRRWCSMDGCGGRAKAAAYYRRRSGRA